MDNWEAVDKLMDGLVRAAEATAAAASGNDKNDWNNFANALRRVRNEIAENKPAQQPVQSVTYIWP